MRALVGKVQFLQKAVVCHPDGRTFLALRRSLDDAIRPGRWDLPGGNVTYGEDHRDAIRREIREETGLDVTDLRPVQVVTEVYRRDDVFPERRSENVAPTEIYLIFVGHRCQALLRSAQDGALSDAVTLSEEHIDYRWVTGEEFVGLEELGFVLLDPGALYLGRTVSWSPFVPGPKDQGDTTRAGLGAQALGPVAQGHRGPRAQPNLQSMLVDLVAEVTRS